MNGAVPPIGETEIAPFELQVEAIFVTLSDILQFVNAKPFKQRAIKPSIKIDNLRKDSCRTIVI